MMMDWLVLGKIGMQCMVLKMIIPKSSWRIRFFTSFGKIKFWV